MRFCIPSPDMTHRTPRLPSPLSAISSAGVALTAFLLLAWSVSVNAQDAARGAALLALAQQAVGGKGLAVKTLQVTGTFRRVVGGNDTEGDFDVFIELPDKYLRSEKTGTPGQPSTETIEALVGGVSRDAVRGGRGGGPRGGTPDGDAVQPADAGDAAAGQREAAPDGAPGETPQADAAADPAPAAGRGRGGAVDPDAQGRARQAEVSRLLLMWLLRSETPLAWVGIAKSPDGTADVLEARYADGQPTRLFVESKTYMPLMLQWTAVPGAGPGGRRGGGGRRGAEAGGAGPPQAVTFDMTFSEHRTVNGIKLPYVITRGSNGQTTERWTVSRYRVNPTFDAGAFTR